MRHHFHRCGHLRLVAIEVGDLARNRKGGSQILEELCQAKNLSRCVGLADCDVLSAAQKRDLLVARATRLREEEGGASQLADAPDPRSAELSGLRSDLLEEYEEIVEENRQARAQAAAALQRNPRPLSQSVQGELAAAGVSVFLDDDLRTLRTARLDPLERAIEAMTEEGYGQCRLCRSAIDMERLRETPDTVVCAPCSREETAGTASSTRPAASSAARRRACG